MLCSQAPVSEYSWSAIPQLAPSTVLAVCRLSCALIVFCFVQFNQSSTVNASLKKLEHLCLNTTNTPVNLGVVSSGVALFS